MPWTWGSVFFCENNSRCVPAVIHLKWCFMTLIGQVDIHIMSSCHSIVNNYIKGYIVTCCYCGLATAECGIYSTLNKHNSSPTSPSRRHQGLSWSEHFWKVEQRLEQQGAIYRAYFGDAETWVCDTVKMTDILVEMLRDNPDLFSDNEPLGLTIQS